MIKRSILALSLLAAGLGSASAQQASTPYKTSFDVKPEAKLAALVPESIRHNGTLNVGTNPNTPPNIFYADDNKTLEGREIDIMSAVAHRIGLEPQWHNSGGFDNIIPGLSTGRYDAALANLDVDETRLKRLDFVDYFNNNRLGIIARKGTFEHEFDHLDQLCGQTIGAGSGTMNATVLENQSEKCVKEGKEKITIPLFPSRPEGVQAVASGRTPAFFGPYESVRYQAQSSRGRLVLAGTLPVPPSFVGIGLAKGSDLTEAVKQSLQSLIDDGTYQRILDHWDIGYGAIKTAQSNQAILDDR